MKRRAFLLALPALTAIAKLLPTRAESWLQSNAPHPCFFVQSPATQWPQTWVIGEPITSELLNANYRRES